MAKFVLEVEVPFDNATLVSMAFAKASQQWQGFRQGSAVPEPFEFRMWGQELVGMFVVRRIA